jgi:hypothetical protein
MAHITYLKSTVDDIDSNVETTANALVRYTPLCANGKIEVV